MHDPYFQNISLEHQQPVNLRCFRRLTGKPWTVNYHFHDMYEVVVYEAIEGSFFCNGDEYAIRRQQALFIPPECIHGFQVSPGKLIYHVMHFSPQFALTLGSEHQFPRNVILAQLCESDFNVILPLLNWTEQRNIDRKIDSSLTTAYKLILDILIENCRDEISRKENRSANHFEPLVKFLNANQQYSISVSAAADLCHMSRSHFLATFKRTYGTTFGNFLEERKINAAKNMLRNTDRTISQIAEYIEVNSSAYFTKIFRNAVGRTPSEYRRKAFSEDSHQK